MAVEEISKLDLMEVVRASSNKIKRSVHSLPMGLYMESCGVSKPFES